MRVEPEIEAHRDAGEASLYVRCGYQAVSSGINSERNH